MIDRETLVPPLWRFGRRGGDLISDRLRFLPDGRIGHSPNENERHWRLADGELHLLAADGRITTRFDRCQRHGARIELSGRYQRTTAGPEIIHTLTPNADDLHVEMNVRGLERTLLVTFGSVGRPYLGAQGTRWEFYKYPQQLDINLFRVAERTDPAFWYLNKTRRVLALLRGLVAENAGPVIAAGMSSGGFAAMLFAEMLSIEFPARPIRTVTVNPQTVHAPEHRRHLERTVDPRFLPAMIDDDALAQADTPVTSIPDLVTANMARRGDVRHAIHLDAGNAVEAYHASFVENLPGFTTRPQHLGVPHVEGIEALFRSGAPFEDVRTFGGFR